MFEAGEKNRPLFYADAGYYPPKDTEKLRAGHWAVIIGSWAAAYIYMGIRLWIRYGG